MESESPFRPRVALIGVTGYGGVYFNLLSALRERGRLEVRAAVVINPESAAASVTLLRSWGAVIYPDYLEMLRQEAGNIDVCLIPTGIQWHARMTIAALHAGMNVLVEKPLAGSMADVLAIREAEAHTKRWVAVGFQDIYSAEAAWVKEQICAGVIGRVEAVRMVGLWPRTRSYFVRNAWAGHLEADGAIVRDSLFNNAFAHFINLSLFFAGSTFEESTEVRIESAELYRVHPIKTFDTAVVRASSPEGVQFWFGASHTTQQVRQPEIHIRGSLGRIEWRHEQRCTLTMANGHRQVFPLPDETDMRRTMFDAVMQKVEDPKTRACTTIIALRHAELIEALHQFGEVQDLPGDCFDWIQADNNLESAIASVHELDVLMDRACQSLSSLAACGFPCTPALSHH